MRRTITQPPDLSGTPLAELKQWLGITRDEEDALLLTVLHASLDLCEGFTGLLPLEVEVEERLAHETGEHRLTSRPVHSLLAIEWLDQAGSRGALDEDDYTFTIAANGSAMLTLPADSEAEAVVLRMTAGLAPDWTSLPAALRQGIIRLAAFHYRDRDLSEPPPPSVTAMWQPWRQMRLT